MVMVTDKVRIVSANQKPSSCLYRLPLLLASTARGLGSSLLQGGWVPVFLFDSNPNPVYPSFYKRGRITHSKGCYRGGLWKWEPFLKPIFTKNARNWQFLRGHQDCPDNTLYYLSFPLSVNTQLSEIHGKRGSESGIKRTILLSINVGLLNLLAPQLHVYPCLKR